jgi:hypothetical protein
MAIWVFNVYLWVVYLFCPQALYQAMRTNGAQWFTCVEVQSNGETRPSDACSGPAPTFAVPEDFSSE